MSRRGRWLAVAGAGLVAMAAGAMPVLLSGKPVPVSNQVEASGSVSPTSDPADTLSPGDQSTPQTTGSSATTSPSTRPPLTTTTAASPTTSTTVGNGCPSGFLAMSVATDRPTYRPGDIINVAVTVVNQSNRLCWVTDRGAGSGSAAACDPEVVVHHNGDADGYKGLLGPYFGACNPSVFTTLAPGDSVTRNLAVPFTVAADCASAPDSASACSLRSGSWTVLATWLTAGISSTDNGKSAQVTVSCPPGACAAGPSDSTTTSSTTSTSSPTTTSSSSTTSTSGPAH